MMAPGCARVLNLAAAIAVEGWPFLCRLAAFCGETINYKGHPTDEDMIAVGVNTKMNRTRCIQIIDEVRAATKELL